MWVSIFIDWPIKSISFKINLSIDIDLSNDFPTSIFIDWLPRGLLADSSSSVFTFLRCPESLGYLWFGATLLPPQFRSCDHSFGKLQLFCLYIFSCTQMSVTNCTIVTFQMNHHMIWIGWQQGCNHASRIRLFIYVPSWISSEKNFDQCWVFIFFPRKCRLVMNWKSSCSDL